MNAESSEPPIADEYQRRRIQFRRIHLNTNIESELFKRALISSNAHLAMLGKTGILSNDACARLKNALAEILHELESGHEMMSAQDADVYEALERHLKKRVGEEFILIRTAKSRNDQAATDLRLWMRDSSLELAERILCVRNTFIDLAKRDIDTVMPGYTHMQPAEAILLSHWWLANEARFSRDFSRLLDFYKRLNLLPLGANVLAGTREPIDRRMVAETLGFDDLIENSLDAVSDRDFLIEFGAFASIIGLHISQLGSELLLWVTQEFAFAKVPQQLTIKSHKLPLKRNPEVLELLRSRPSMIFGRMMEFIVQLKSITTGFSLDLQECVLGFADIVDTLDLLLDLLIGMLPGMDLDTERMREVACADLVNVSNAHDYLLNRGVSREVASRVVEQLGIYCRTRNKYLSDLGLNEWQQFSPAFEDDIYNHVSVEESVGAFCSFGGSSREQVDLGLSRSADAMEMDSRRLKQVIEKMTAKSSDSAGVSQK
ncbi:MAG: argininosuccinate lyase [Candidatus Obscuribacterales bacterium]|nr:argininosuccinate lyase [Candidatus Obscuribacterales bacterium]